MNLKRIGLVFGLAWLASTGMAAAEDAVYDHIHLVSTDAAAAVDWYSTHMGGARMAQKGRVSFGRTIVIFYEREEPGAGTAGSSVDHIGFSFPDLPAKMKDYEAAGVKILSEVRDVQGKFKFAFVEDPWGTKIEVMEDKETLGFHHIHLRGAEPAELLDWYQNAFGGKRTKYMDMLDAVLYGNVWVLAQSSRGAETAGTAGLSLDHLGFAFDDLNEAAVRLKEKGVKFTVEPRDFPNKEIAIAIAFVEGPGGVRIELVQRP